jgi:hypothetical protein
LDGAQKNPALDVPVLVFLDDLSDSLRVFLPNLKGYEGWICQHKVKIVVILFGNQLRVIEVVLEKIGVFVGEFLIVLNRLSGLHRKGR